MGQDIFLSYKKKDRKKAKIYKKKPRFNKTIIGILLGVIISLIILAFIFIGPSYNEPVIANNLVVLKEDDLYQARFSLMDDGQVQTAWDGEVSFMIKNDDNILYVSNFLVSQEDFETYTLTLTGATFLAYSWYFQTSDVKNVSEVSINGEAELTFTTPEGNTFQITYEVSLP